ncbi:MAG: glycosyltransferase 87 family protein [Clostridia bacterium]|nr:glycosyltransferase 87 family protein [Clostridia bacterium]
MTESKNKASFAEAFLKKLNIALLISAAVALVGFAFLTLIPDIPPVFSFLHRLAIPELDDAYGDFFNVLEFIKNRSPYTYFEDNGLQGTANYPPLAYLLMYPFYLLASVGGEISVHDPWGLTSMVLYILIATVPVAVLFCRKLGFTRSVCVLTALGVFTSYLAYFEIERLNVILYATLFLTVYCSWYDSDSKVKRQFAYMGLAAAGAIKLYPLFLGVLLIRDKRFKDCFIVAFYFAVFFFLPFFFFKGGIGNLKLFIGEILKFNGEHSVDFNMNDVSFKKMIASYASLISGKSVVEIFNSSVLTYIKYGFFALSCIALFTVKDKFKFALLATCAYLNFTDLNYTYCLLLMLPPFMYLINSERLSDETFAEEDKTFILLGASILTYYMDLAVVVPAFIGVVAFISARKGVYKTINYFFAFLSVFTIVLEVIATVTNLGTIFVIDVGAFACMLQIARALPVFVMQVVLITSGFESVVEKIKKKRNTVDFDW